MSTDPAATLAAVQAVDIGAADTATCARLLGDTKRLRGWVDAVEADVTKRMRLLHDEQGGAPAADLHSRCGGVSAAEGKRKERRSKTIDDAPSFGDALASGEIGAEHVDALGNVTAKLEDAVKDELFDRADDLLDQARNSSPEEFGRACRDLARKLERDNGLERNRRQRRDTFLSRKLNMATGMTEGRFALHPELANQIFGAIDREVTAMVAEGTQAGEADCVDRSVDRNRLAAEALGRLVAGGHQQRRPLEADVTLIADITTLITGVLHDDSICETSDGSPLPPASLRRLVCQGRINPIYVDGDGNPFSFGREIRHANRRQRRALRALHRTCAFGDCDTPFERCEMHHIHPWELGGLTDLDNIVPLCSRHHHVVHDGNWTLELAPDRTLTIRQPNGETFIVCVPDVPPQRRRDRHRQPAA